MVHTDVFLYYMNIVTDQHLRNSMLNDLRSQIGYLTYICMYVVTISVITPILRIDEYSYLFNSGHIKSLIIDSRS